jgi:hypothetical protein
MQEKIQVENGELKIEDETIQQGIVFASKALK